MIYHVATPMICHVQPHPQYTIQPHPLPSRNSNGVSMRHSINCRFTLKSVVGRILPYCSDVKGTHLITILPLSHLFLPLPPPPSPPPPSPSLLSPPHPSLPIASGLLDHYETETAEGNVVLFFISSPNVSRHYTYTTCTCTCTCTCSVCSVMHVY